MARVLKRLAFLLDGFAVPSPGQQLLDRFLIGYPRAGGFHRLEGVKLSVHCPQGAGDAHLERRAGDFGLERSPGRAEALRDADAAVVAGPDAASPADGSLIEAAIQGLAAGAPVFVHGPLAGGLGPARRLADLATSRQVPLAAGTALAAAGRLPEVDLQRGAEAAAALIVVQGEASRAALDGLEGLLPLIERRKGGEAGAAAVRYLAGEDLWKAGETGLWSRTLLAAALSRSDTPQGDAVADGRTQDLVGLGLVPRLARGPRGFLVEHLDGLRSAILALDGVVADIDFAVQLRDGTTVSAQLHRPPPPAEHHYSRLVEAVEVYFRSGKPPWPLERSLLEAGLLEAFQSAAGRAGERLPTPELAIAYSLTSS